MRELHESGFSILRDNTIRIKVWPVSMAYFLPLPSIKRNPRRVSGIWGEHDLKNSNQLNFRSKPQQHGTKHLLHPPSECTTESLELHSCTGIPQLSMAAVQSHHSSSSKPLVFVYKHVFSICSKSPFLNYKVITHTDLPVPASFCNFQLQELTWLFFQEK